MQTLSAEISAAQEHQQSELQQYQHIKLLEKQQRQLRRVESSGALKQEGKLKSMLTAHLTVGWDWASCVSVHTPCMSWNH